jgi:broad specificity phosphatase PhoE
MNQQLSRIFVVRHGETEWSASGRHTGLTDIALTQKGEQDARHLGEVLQGLKFTDVFASPLARAWRTSELAGFGERVMVDNDLVEWDYGAYEGKTTGEIQQQRSAWDVFKNGCPEGESVSQVSARADRVITRLRALGGNALLFSHSHFLRMLAARWLGLEPSAGRCFLLKTASLSILGYEHGRDDPVIRLWNDRHHLGDAE